MSLKSKFLQQLFTNNKLLFFTSILLLSQGCIKQPEADFRANSTSVEIGDTVRFTNTSINSNSYLWNFGDSTQSEETNPIKVYDNEGTYTVFLTAFSRKEKKSEGISKQITVLEAPNNFKATINGNKTELVVNNLNITSSAAADSELDIANNTYNASYKSIVRNEITNEQITITIGKLTYPINSIAQTTDFATMLANSQIIFSENPLLSNGVKIDYVDNNGLLWSSNLNAQNTSSFTIVSSKYINVNGVDFIKIKAAFNCILNDVNGNALEINNATYKGFFQNL